MKISDLLKLSTDNLRRRKGRTALTVIGVVVGTCAIVVMISLGIATNRRTDEMLSTWSDLTMIEVYNYSNNPDTPALDDKMIESFKQIKNVTAATPMYHFGNMDARVVAGKKDRYSTWMHPVGMDLQSIIPMGVELVSGEYLNGQAMGAKKIPVMVGEDYAYEFEDTKKSWRSPDRFRWKETDENGNVIKPPFFDINKEKLTMKMIYGYDDQGEPKAQDYELIVVGVMKTDYSKECTTGILMNIADMKRLEEDYKKLTKKAGGGSGGGIGSATVSVGGMGHGPDKVEGYDQVYVKVDEVDHVVQVEQTIKELGYETHSMSQYREDMQKQVASGQMMLGGLAAVSLLVAALNIANTMTMAIYERTKEIGVMKVLGCKLSKIREMFLIESGSIGFIGGVIGCIFSLLISWILNNFTVWMQAIVGWLMQMGVQVDMSSMSFSMGSLFGMGGMGGMEGIGNISDIPPWLLLAALAFATLVGLLSGIAPANRAVKISALEAIRHE